MKGFPLNVDCHASMSLVARMFRDGDMTDLPHGEDLGNSTCSTKNRVILEVHPALSNHVGFPSSRVLSFLNWRDARPACRHVSIESFQGDVSLFSMQTLGATIG